MITNDTTLRTNYVLNGSHQFNNDNNEIEYIFDNVDILSPRDINNFDNFDNKILCQKYGQKNIEKAILLLTLIILCSVAILYYYWKFFKLYYIRLLLITSSVDIILLLFYCALRLTFNSNEWINSFPSQFYIFMDYILIINFILKLIIFIIYFFYRITLSSIFLFSGKFLLELYLLLSCVKMIIFCPGYKWCSTSFEVGVGWIQYLFICCDNQENREFNRLSDDSSDTNYSNNSLEIE